MRHFIFSKQLSRKKSVVSGKKRVPLGKAENKSPEAGFKKPERRYCSRWRFLLLLRGYTSVGENMLFAVDIGVFVGSVVVLSFVYVSFLKKMVKKSSEVSKEREKSASSKNHIKAD